MLMLKLRALCLVMVLAPACGGRLVEFPLADGGKTDSSTTDTAKGDDPKLDARMPDGGAADVASNDVLTRVDGSPDVRVPDAEKRDSAVADTGMVDLRLPDTGNREVGNIDTPTVDMRVVDARFADVWASETPILDGARIEADSGIDAAMVDAASDVVGIEALATDVGSMDGSGSGPAIVVNLGLAKPFAIAATAGVTNTITAPITHINGDVVLTPSQTCNAVFVDNAGGFGLCAGMPPTISGTVITNLYPDTTTAAAIKADLNAAFLSLTPLAGPPAVGSLGGGTALAAPTTLGNVAGSPLVLGDNWFAPGVYTSITSILITGDITLDGQGDPNAAFVFQSASTLTTADGAPSPGAHVRILLTNGTKASNVWWQVASSTTLGSYSEFQGSILAAFNITMKTGSTSCGRSMAGAWVGGGGAYIFDSNVVSVPGNGCPL